MELNYQLTKIPKFTKNEIPKLETRTNLQFHNSIKKHTKTQPLASLTLKDNPKKLYEILKTLRLTNTLLKPRDNVQAI